MRPGHGGADAGTRTPNLPLTRRSVLVDQSHYRRRRSRGQPRRCARGTPDDSGSCHEQCHGRGSGSKPGAQRAGPGCGQARGLPSAPRGTASVGLSPAVPPHPIRGRDLRSAGGSRAARRGSRSDGSARGRRRREGSPRRFALDAPARRRTIGRRVRGFPSRWSRLRCARCKRPQRCCRGRSTRAPCQRCGPACSIEA